MKLRVQVVADKVQETVVYVELLFVISSELKMNTIAQYHGFGQDTSRASAVP